MQKSLDSRVKAVKRNQGSTGIDGVTIEAFESHLFILAEERITMLTLMKSMLMNATSAIYSDEHLLTDFQSILLQGRFMVSKINEKLIKKTES